jgi:hypothetical protein
MENTLIAIAISATIVVPAHALPVCATAVPVCLISAIVGPHKLNPFGALLHSVRLVTRPQSNSENFSVDDCKTNPSVINATVCSKSISDIISDQDEISNEAKQNDSLTVTLHNALTKQRFISDIIKSLNDEINKLTLLKDDLSTTDLKSRVDGNIKEAEDDLAHFEQLLSQVAFVPPMFQGTWLNQTGLATKIDAHTIDFGPDVVCQITGIKAANEDGNKIEVEYTCRHNIRHTTELDDIWYVAKVYGRDVLITVDADNSKNLQAYQRPSHN